MHLLLYNKQQAGSSIL